MALSLVTSTSLALRPDSQHALAHRPEITPATRDSETAQYKNVLAVAVSQEPGPQIFGSRRSRDGTMMGPSARNPFARSNASAAMAQCAGEQVTI